MKSWMNWVAMMFVAVVMAACGGGGDSGSCKFNNCNSQDVIAVTVSVSPTTITLGSPAVVSATVTTNGSPLRNTVVNFTNNTTLGTLSAVSALTDSNGVATVTLNAASASASGADTVTASVTAGGATVTGQATYAVTPSGGGAGLHIGVSLSSQLVSLATPATVTAIVTNNGAPVAGSIVTFAVNGTVGKLSVTSALTDANGIATSSLSPASDTASGADTVTVTTVVNGATTTASANYQIQVGPGAAGVKITLGLSSNTLTLAAPITATATVTNNGLPVPGVIVTFADNPNIGLLSVTSALTDASGVASTTITQANVVATGADQLTAAVNLSGQTATASQNYQIAGNGNQAGLHMLLSLSSTTVTSAAPVTATAIVAENGVPVAGSIVTFSVNPALGKLSANTALTDANGVATVSLSPANQNVSGADTITATVTADNLTATASKGYQLTATSAAITAFTSDKGTGGNLLPAYDQAVLTLTLSGVSQLAPATVNITSTCLGLGKASISPTSFSNSTGQATVTYTDKGCGAVVATDIVTASISGTTSTQNLTIALTAPTANSVTFISATPSPIYLKGSGYTESSTVTFKVVDQAGVGIPGLPVTLNLSTFAGGITLNGGTVPVTQTTDSSGQVSVIVNSGTIPTPVGVFATYNGITTVSSALSIATGLPTEANFSLSQATTNIEGGENDGIPNTYTVFVGDRSGTPVPDGTVVQFIAEGGQAHGQALTTGHDSGTAKASVTFVTADPRFADQRYTITAYAVGEKSFFDANGNNIWDPTEPFMDIGDVVKDKLQDGLFDPTLDEFFSLYAPGYVHNSVCSSANAVHTELQVNYNIPNLPNSCDGKGPDGLNKVYVRKSIETIFSYSEARPVFDSTSFRYLDASCALTQAIGQPVVTGGGTTRTIVKHTHPFVDGAVVHVGAGNSSGSFTILAADINDSSFNPLPAGTQADAVSLTDNFTTAVVGGSPVASTDTPPVVTVNFRFTAGTTTGHTSITFKTPRGVTSAASLTVTQDSPVGTCVAP